MRKALLIVPENGNYDLSTNNVNLIVIIQTLNRVKNELQTQLMREVEKAVGVSKIAQEQFLDIMIKQCNLKNITGEEILKTTKAT